MFCSCGGFLFVFFELVGSCSTILCQRATFPIAFFKSLNSAYSVGGDFVSAGTPLGERTSFSFGSIGDTRVTRLWRRVSDRVS
jgi:hypothetical protein